MQKTEKVGGSPESEEGDGKAAANLEEETIQGGTEAERTVEEEEEEESPTDKAEESLSEEEPMAMEDSAMTEDSALDPSTQTLGSAQDTPCWRKRISSKSLKVGMIPSKRVCLIEEPEGEFSTHMAH